MSKKNMSQFTHQISKNPAYFSVQILCFTVFQIDVSDDISDYIPV